MSKFQIYKDVAGNYRWRLVANNGEKVAASEAYANKQNAERSAKRVREIALVATIEPSISSVLNKLLRKK